MNVAMIKLDITDIAKLMNMQKLYFALRRAQIMMNVQMHK